METLAQLTPGLSVAPQISEQDVGVLAARGFQSIVNNRPDGEADDQPTSAAIEAAARRSGLQYRHVPVVVGKIADADIAAFRNALSDLPGPVLAFCRTGTRSTTLWALSETSHLSPDTLLDAAKRAGYELDALRPRLDALWRAGHASQNDVPAERAATVFDVLVIGGGAAGIATASSLLRRRPDLSVAIVEPSERHYYQPGWTLVGGGVFDRARTERAMSRVMPRNVRWVKATAAEFEPERNRVLLDDGTRLGYRMLVVCPGLKLDWAKVEGLSETLGRNGVTSNYLFDLAPYTWELVQQLRAGRAVFTQPVMPIKCAGAPQKAMYLSCDHWRRQGVLKNIAVEFDAAGPVLFGVKEFVPSLMRYVERYGIELRFNSNLVAVDGPARKAWFDVKREDGSVVRAEKSFDMLHVCPPQTAPDFVRSSPLADATGWVEVNQDTLQHTRFGNVFALGDVCSAPNAKTAAAVRKQAPVVAENVWSALDGKGPRAIYDGYGSCPLTVERGKIVLAEFGYGGKLLPTFPFLDATKPSRLAWFLKAKVLPPIYFDLMLKGREWLAKPNHLPDAPQPDETAGNADITGPAPANRS